MIILINAMGIAVLMRLEATALTIFELNVFLTSACICVHPRLNRSSMNGFLILDKPLGLSSAAMLNRVKRMLPRGTKIGHAGTLDPLASGVLVAMIGKATKQCETVMGQPKQYEATITLGATSATDDAEGPLTPVEVAAPPTQAEIDEVLKRFVGVIEQLPPAFSAIKVGGRRACDRVRDGQAVELKPRPIRIDAIDVLSYAWPDLSIRMDCGRGTYVRSVARDVGGAIGTGGYLSGLRRTRVGDFRAEAAATLEALTEQGVERFLIPLPTSQS